MVQSLVIIFETILSESRVVRARLVFMDRISLFIKENEEKGYKHK